jgi:hypothetical protein
VTPIPIPDVPWQVTGNHWLALPCIHPADASLHALGVLHRGARAALEFAGDPGFLAGAGRPLMRPVLRIDGEEQVLGAQGLAWERANGWLPTFTCTVDGLVLRGTVFAPHGRDADVAGAVYALAVENRGKSERRVTLSLEGTLGHRQLRVRSARAADDAHRVVAAPGGVVVLEGSAQPGLAALAIAADGEARIETGTETHPRFALHRDLVAPAGGSASTAFYIAAGPERDGAEATVEVMRRRGWSELLTLTRDALQGMEQTVGHDGIDRLINRNLLFAYFYACGRAIDDAHFYLVRSRAPWNGRGITVTDWESLSWTLPAVQLADAPFARELLLRSGELHGYAPGNGTHYMDGTLFEPGFSLEGAAAFALAADRYIRDTGDDGLVEEPVVADTLYNAWEDLSARRDEHIPLFRTEVTLAGQPASHPYPLHGNAVAAVALEVFKRTLDEETARTVQDPEAVRAALRRHFAVERDGKVVFASTVDLAGAHDLREDAHASAYWLPLYEAVERHDSVYRRTLRGASDTGEGATNSGPEALARRCAMLVGPDAAAALKWLRRAPLDNGLAAEFVDAEGRALSNGGDAALAGLVAWCAWYAVHALGARP